MDDNLTEGNLNSGGDANTNSTSSQRQGQPLEATLSAQIATLQKKLDAQAGEINALKSGKDKAVDRVVKSQEETLAKLAHYLDVDEDKVREAQRQSVLDALIDERLGGVQSASPIPGKVGEQTKAESRSEFAVADAIAQVEEYALSPNEADFIALLKDKSLTSDKVKDYILGKMKPEKAVSSAGVIQPASVGSTSIGDDTAALLKQFHELKRFPTSPEYKAVKQKLDERGWK